MNSEHYRDIVEEINSPPSRNKKVEGLGVVDDRPTISPKAL